MNYAKQMRLPMKKDNDDSERPRALGLFSQRFCEKLKKLKC